jgi:hypothetical protein
MEQQQQGQQQQQQQGQQKACENYLSGAPNAACINCGRPRDEHNIKQQAAPEQQQQSPNAPQP